MYSSHHSTIKLFSVHMLIPLVASNLGMKKPLNNKNPSFCNIVLIGNHG
jgi:hypothetical protein